MSETTSKVVTYEALDQTGLNAAKLVTYIVIDPALVVAKLVTYAALDPAAPPTGSAAGMLFG